MEGCWNNSHYKSKLKNVILIFFVHTVECLSFSLTLSSLFLKVTISLRDSLSIICDKKIVCSASPAIIIKCENRVLEAGSLN